MTEAHHPAVALASWLIQQNTTNPPGNERPLLQSLDGRLMRQGFETRLIDYLEPGRAQLLARLPGAGESAPLVLSGHVDVVPAGLNPWERDPFSGAVAKGQVHGRGACDMKGGVAALIAAAEAAAAAGRPRSGDLWLVLTADEERNCLGAEDLAGAGLLPAKASCIVAEPTDLHLYLAEKGAFWIAVEVRGRTAHGSAPHCGINAVDAGIRVVERWRAAYDGAAVEHPQLGRPTLSVNLFSGGVKTNVVPDRCRIEMDMRTVPPMDHGRLLETLRQIAAEEAGRSGAEITVSVLSDRASVASDSGSRLALSLARAVREIADVDPAPRAVPYCTEMCIWQPFLGWECVICGPGSPSMAHMPDECVPVQQLEFATAIYTRVIEDLL